MRLGFALCVLLAVPTFIHAEEESVPGLVGEYFAIGSELLDFPNIAAERKPNVKKVDKFVNVPLTEEGFNGTELTDQFYIRWTGGVKIEKDGAYKFIIESDDGSRLFVDGKLAVDNGGNHAMEEKAADIELKAGVHEIKLEFFENSGGAGCVLKWQPPGAEKAVIPATALVHKNGADQ